MCKTNPEEAAQRELGDVWTVTGQVIDRHGTFDHFRVVQKVQLKRIEILAYPVANIVKRLIVEPRAVTKTEVSNRRVVENQVKHTLRIELN